MEDAENIYVSVVFYEVGDTVVPIEQYSDMAS